jgi:subtilase family serine protease
MHRILGLFLTLFLTCQFAVTQVRSVPRGITTPVRDDDTIQLRGNVHPKARAINEIGPMDFGKKLDKMVLVLGLRPGAQADLDNLIQQQHDPSSPLFHKWITPEQFGTRFGIGDDDLATVTQWLTSHGFTVDEIGTGRTWINFSGTTGQVEEAFHTQMKQYLVNGKVHHANATDPQIPRAMSGIVKGVLSLHDFRKTPNHVVLQENLTPGFTSSTGGHFLAPADFATIYNVKPLYNAGINGTGQTIAIVGRTDINLGDVTFFRSFFGLPANSPTIVHNGTDPGDLGGGEETEALLDVEWSGAVAKNAAIKFVVSASTATTDGVDLSAQFIVNNNLAAAMSTSFGQCESSMGTTENNFYNNLWSQAAAQGITSFVSSGDSGAAGCSASNATTGSGRAVSGLCSTPNNVCVGGSQFNDTANPSQFWAATNNSTDQSSALNYIPEIVWNESGNVAGGSGLAASGGGASSIYAKPSFQAAPGVPADGHRDVPDVSLSAAGHDGYIVVQGHTTGTTGLEAVGGTSASSPSFAGLMALVNQKTGARQGNANTVFYPMAVRQYSNGGVAVYHDVTSGNNSVPGTTGFSATTAYDEATGLGTVDANSMVTNWGATTTPDFTIASSPTSVSIAQGNSGSTTITTTVSGGFNSAIALSATGQPAGSTVTFTPSSIAAPGSGTSTMGISVPSTVATGTYTITVTGTGGTTTHAVSVGLTVTAAPVPDFALSASPASVSVKQGTSGSSTITSTIASGFNAAVALTASGAPAGMTVTVAPTSIAAPGSGTSTATFTVASTTATGTYAITVTGTGGGKTHTTTVSVTVTSAAAQQLLGNPGFENGSANPSPWTPTAGVINNSTAEPPHSGAWDAWLDGYGVRHTDTLFQTVAIPSTVTTATLSFFLHIDTAETTTTTAFDTLQVQVRNSTGTTILRTLGTFSNLNHAAGYSQKSFDLSAFKGQTVRIYFVGSEDTSLQTSFVIDDTALNVQ